MKSKFTLLLAVVAGLVLTSGCYSTLDGHVNGGRPWAKDKIVSSYERSADDIFAAAKAVLAFNGTLQGENTINKTVWAKVDTRTVWIQITQVDPKLSSVATQVRTKGGGTDIDLASEIDKQIALKLVK